MPARKAAGIALAALLGTEPAWALDLSLDRLEHLGSPPPGFAQVELVSESSAAPIQFAGSVEPPTVLMNGSPLQIAPFEGDPKLFAGAGPQAWLDGRPIEVSGEIGSFFLELPPSESGRAEVVVTLRSAEGRLTTAKATLNRAFLDAPVRAVSVVPNSMLASGASGVSGEPGPAGVKFPFRLSGAIPKGSRLEVRDSTVVSGSDSATVEFVAPLGKSLLPARLMNADGSSRVIDVPFHVRVREVEASGRILSLEAPDGQAPGSDWEIPANGFRVRGLATRASRLFVDGRRIKVADDGGFEFLVLPRSAEERVEIRLFLPGEPATAYRKTFRCGECATSADWHSPRFRRAGESYLNASIASTRWVRAAGGSPKLSVIGLSPSFGLGNLARHNLAIELSAAFFAASPRGFQVTAGFAWLPWARAWLGAGVVYSRLSSGVGTDAIQQQFGAALHAGLRWPLDRWLGSAWEASSRIQYQPSSLSAQLYESSFPWASLTAELVALRWYFGGA